MFGIKSISVCTAKTSFFIVASMHVYMSNMLQYNSKFKLKILGHCVQPVTQYRPVDTLS